MKSEILEVSQSLYILISDCKNIGVAVMRMFEVNATITLTRGSPFLVHFEESNRSDV
jgi:hypothetical protein